MLTVAQLQEAKYYNYKRELDEAFRNVVWPWPFDVAAIGGGEFEWLTAFFQCESGLVVNGKMDADTLEKILELCDAEEREDNTIAETPSAKKK